MAPFAVILASRLPRARRTASVSSHPGPQAAARPGDTAGTLRLLAYLALAIALLVLDHRGGWLRQVRGQAQLLVQPVWALA